MKPECAKGSFPVKEQAGKSLPLGQSRHSKMGPSLLAAVAQSGNWVRESWPIHLIQAPPLHSAFSLQSFQSKEALFPLQNKQNKLSPCSLIWGFCVADGLNRSNLLSSWASQKQYRNSDVALGSRKPAFCLALWLNDTWLRIRVFATHSLTKASRACMKQKPRGSLSVKAYNMVLILFQLYLSDFAFLVPTHTPKAFV